MKKAIFIHGGNVLSPAIAAAAAAKTASSLLKQMT
jgi:hypothetical protein